MIAVPFNHTIYIYTVRSRVLKLGFDGWRRHPFAIKRIGADAASPGKCRIQVLQLELKC